MPCGEELSGKGFYYSAHFHRIPQICANLYRRQVQTAKLDGILKMRLILASLSKARADLLCAAGYSFDQKPSGIDERPIQRGESPADYVQSLAEDKARKVAADHPEAFTLAADTVLVCGSHITGKPSDMEDAVRMLCKLTGETHRLMTGICIIPPSSNGTAKALTGVDVAFVTLRAMTEDRIRSHVQAAKPLEYAGAYALQKQGVILIERMEGDPNTVIGLPMTLTERLLRQAGYVNP